MKFARITLYLMFFAYGLTITLMSPLVTEVSAEFGLNATEAGLINTINYLGGVAGIVLLLFITSKIKKGWIFIAASGILAAMMFVAGAANAFIPLLVFMFILGFGMKIVDSLGTPVLADRFAGKTDNIGHSISLMYMFFSIGAFASPVVVGIIKYSVEFSWRDCFMLFAVIVMVFFVLFVVGWRDTGKKDAVISDVHSEEKKELFRNSDLWVMCVMLFLYCFHQTGLTYWTASYFSLKEVPQIVADFSASLLWIGVIVGRLVNSRMKKDIGIPQAVWGSLVSGILIISAIIFDLPYFLLAAYFISGVLLGAMIPVFLSKMTGRFPKFSGIVATILTLSFVAGSSLTTVVMGGIADSAGMQVSMLVGGGLPLVAAFVIGIIQFRKRALFK